MTLYLHYTDANNYLAATLSSTTLALVQSIAGVVHTLASTAISAINGVRYWLRITQFPTVTNDPASVQAALFADAAGAVGAQVGATVGPIATFDTITALSGAPQIAVSGGALGLSGTHTVALFGPGGWLTSDYVPDATYSHVAYGWEQSTANTYIGGPATSYGAARVDVPPAGKYNASWVLGDATSLTTLRQTAIPVSAGGNTLAVSVAVKATGLSANGTVQVNAIHYDATGANLSTTFAVALHSGSTVGWQTLSGSCVTPANTAFVLLQLVAYNGAVAGADAGGVVWFDNAQVWNVTTTGVAAGAMPYCELRFQQSPAQLLVTGLLGDLPAPAHLAWGVYLASWATGSTLTYALGRRAQATANARLAMPSLGYYGAALTPTATPVRDATAYGGYYPSALANPTWNPRAFSFPASDLPGVYHLFTRFWTAQALANLGNVQTRVTAEQKTGIWFGDITGADAVGEYYGPYVAPISASSTWTIVDAGQFTVPMFPTGALTDLTATYLTPRSQWTDATGGGSQCRSDWQLLLPVDGSLLVGVVNNPSNGNGAITAEWLWAYHDGLLVNRAAVGDSAATTYSVEASPLPAPSRGAGGPGTQSTGVVNINSGADPYLTVDPTVSCGTTAGVNQFAGYVADNAGDVLPLHVELQYSPLYLYPR